MLVKAFISICILPLMFLIPADHAKVPSSSPEFLGKTTTAGVGFGKPTARCQGHGICLVTADIESRSPMKDNFGMADLTIGRNGTVTKMLVHATSMSKPTIEKHFSGKNFIMEDAYKGSLKMDGKNLKITIPAGKHRIEKSKNGFLLDILR